MACLNPLDPQTLRIYSTEDVFHSVMANNGAGMARDGILFRVKKKGKDDFRRVAGSRHPSSVLLCCELGSSGNGVTAGFSELKEKKTNGKDYE